MATDDENRGSSSRRIGSLISETLTSLSTKGATTPGSPSRAPAAGTTIGPRGTSLPTTTRHGGLGSGTPTALQRRATAMVAQARTGTLQRNPAALLPQSIRSSIAETWVDGDTGYGWDGYVTRYDLTQLPSDQDADLAAAIAEATLEPASEREIVVELGRLRSLTVSREIGADLSLAFAAYTEELRRYPADAVREVLREWPKTQRFWPSMAELVLRLDRLVKPRQALQEALGRGYVPFPDSPDWVPPPTEADKAAVAALLAEHGYRIEPDGRVRPPPQEPLTKRDRERVAAETAAFRLPDADDPRVLARLRQMAETDPA